MGGGGGLKQSAVVLPCEVRSLERGVGSEE